MIAIRVNGETREIESGNTVRDLLQTLGVDPELVAVEHNGKILDPDELERVKILGRDTLEIVRFMGGG